MLKIDQTTKNTVKRISAINSIQTRSGQTRTLSSGSLYSDGFSPCSILSSFIQALCIPSQVKKKIEQTISTMGKLSPFIRITLKFLSMQPMAKKAVITTIATAHPFLVHSKQKPSLRLRLSNQSVGGKRIGVTTVKIEKLIVGADK